MFPCVYLSVILLAAPPGNGGKPAQRASGTAAEEPIHDGNYCGAYCLFAACKVLGVKASIQQFLCPAVIGPGAPIGPISLAIAGLLTAGAAIGWRVSTPERHLATVIRRSREE